MSLIARGGHYLGYAMLYGLFALGMPAWADSISGTYVGKFSNLAALAQIVKTSDGHLTGRYEEVFLKPDGNIQNFSDTFDGAIDGHTFAGKIGNILGMAVSGTIDGSVMDLNGGGNFHRTLSKANESAFRAQVAFLTKRANDIKAANAQTDLARRRGMALAADVSHLQSLTQQMSSFMPASEEALGRAQQAQYRYQAITAKMRGRLAKEQETSGRDINSSVRRNNLSISISDAGIEANNVHIKVRWLGSSFGTDSNQLLASAAQASKACGKSGVAEPSDPSSLKTSGWLAACVRFNAVDKEFESRIRDVRAGYINLENIWKKEREEQNSIMQTAQASVHL